MNKQVIKAYIEEYKKNFDRVHLLEIYKWKAIQQFQDKFNIDETDFHANLVNALNIAGNLLSSGNYYPKKVLLDNAKKSPEKVRQLFKALYNENTDLLKRIEDFRTGFKTLHASQYHEPNHYQDHRAIIVYLTLCYPERYFLYKYKMFKDFVEKIEYPYKPSIGKTQNIGQFQNLCQLVRYEIEQDQELLKRHEDRLGADCYRDIRHHVLTQDFIYSVTRHLDKPTNAPQVQQSTLFVEEVQAAELETQNPTVDLTPKLTNHIQNNIENKRLGDLGEIWVLEHEKEYLTNNKQQKLADKVTHVAKNEGDGTGFDILSFDIKGNKKYIEVKTTKGQANTTFYITRNELEKSKTEQDNYFLYRVYNFDEAKGSAKILKIQGDLSSICEVPVNYKIKLKHKQIR